MIRASELNSGVFCLIISDHTFFVSHLFIQLHFLFDFFVATSMFPDQASDSVASFGGHWASSFYWLIQFKGHFFVLAQMNQTSEKLSDSQRSLWQMMSSSLPPVTQTNSFCPLCPILWLAGFTMPQTVAHRSGADHIEQNSLRVSPAHRVKLVAFSLQHPNFSHSPQSWAARQSF